MIEYKDTDVLTAARRRIAAVFDWFDDITVSVSSGKDSTVMYALALAEAERRGRRVRLFFLDQEAEWQSSVDLIQKMMRHPAVIPEWYQVPIGMTNATSHTQYFLNAWGEGEAWMREKDSLAIHTLDAAYPRRFYPFFEWHESRISKPTAFLVGLRSKESLTRFRAVTQNAGYQNILWSTQTKSQHGFRFYPVYDWTFGDVWKFISDNQIPYNRYYDRMFCKYGTNMSKMRVSNLIHEKSFRALADLQEFEPETYDRLCRRLNGVHCAALYATDRFVYSAAERPARFATWRAYRDYLVATTPGDKMERFRKRFSKQAEDETTCQQQCRQLLLNDWENNVGLTKTKTERLQDLWWDRL